MGGIFTQYEPLHLDDAHPEIILYHYLNFGVLQYALYHDKNSPYKVFHIFVNTERKVQKTFNFKFTFICTFLHISKISVKQVLEFKLIVCTVF